MRFIGLTLAYPLLINEHFVVKEQGSKIKPPSKTPNLGLPQRLTLWNRAYILGHWCPILTAIATFAMLPSAVKAQDAWLIGASALQISIVPFTLVFIKPVNDHLMAIREAANNEGEVLESEVEDLFSKWVTLHNARVLLTFAGFVTAVSTTVRS